MNCPRCAFSVAADAKFCSNCGLPLAGRAAEGERRQVTVLFCDLKGSTALAESLDPEDWGEIVSGAFAALIEPVARYEGTVARVMGDAVLAYFGAPTAHEDDPERAVLASLEMREALGRYRDRLRAERGISEFDLRIGINTGLAVLGDATGAGIEYTAMGDAVNVAARLQQAAEPGAILVGESTGRQVAGRFELRELRPLEVKGRKEPVAAFEILGRRLAEGDRGLSAPFVGRAAELAALRGALAEVRTGRGRIVALIGEAGLGKSRLIDELRLEQAAGGEDWSVARGQSYGAARSFLLIRQHLLSWIGASEGDAPDAVREKLSLLTKGLASDALEVVLGVEREGAARLEGEAFREELHRQLRAVVERRFRERPGAVVFDDLHWSDAASVDMLIRLLATSDELGVLFLAALRPDRQSPAWRTKLSAETDYPHRYTELTLGPLSGDECAALLRGLLGGAELPEALCRRVLEKAEGNPLYLEEIVRSLIQDGTLAREGGSWRVTRDAADVRVPESLQALASARIDRLAEDERQTLQAAAVVGRTFRYEVLSRITEADGRLDRHLATLQRVELVREVSRAPDRVYAFRHAITQEAAYGSLLQRRRRELHLRVGETLESLHVGAMEEHAALIGNHFAEAADARAIHYLRLASERAMRLYALEEAIAHTTRALALTRTFHSTTAVLMELYERRGRAHELRAEYDQALANYEEMERAGVERDDAAMELAALGRRITIHATPTSRRDLALAERLLERALPAARERGERAVVARLQWGHTQVADWRGRPEEAIAAGEEAIALARELDLRELLAFALNDITGPYAMTGQIDGALAALSEATERFRELGNKPMEADSLSTRAGFAAWTGDYDGALRAGAEARRLSDETGNDWGRAFSAFAVPWVLYERGDWGGAIAMWEEGLAFGVKAGFVVMQVGPRADLGWLYFQSGDAERAKQHLLAADEVAASKLADLRGWSVGQRARVAIAEGALVDAAALIEVARETAANVQLPPAAVPRRVAEAELLLARGDHAGAAEAIRRAFAEQKATFFVPFLADWKWLEGEAERRSGETERAIAAFEAGERLARQVGSRRILWRILAALSELRAERGEGAAAEAALAEAREIVEGIARSLERVGLSERFHALAHVRAVTSQPAEATG